MSSAEGYVLPKPGIPKTLGILNIIFGVILILVGLCVVGSTIAMPMLLEFGQKAQKEVQAKEAEKRNAELKSIDDQIAAAKTDEEKAKLETEKKNVVDSVVEPPDISAVTDLYKNPTIMTYNTVHYGSGTVMSLILLIAGIGLVRLQSWGRTLSLWLAGIQLVRLTVLTAVSLIVVQPETARAMTNMMTKIEAQAKAQGAPANAGQAAQAGKSMAMMGSASVVGYFIFGSIYPIVTLILLSRPGARAACQPRKSFDSPEFLS